MALLFHDLLILRVEDVDGQKQPRVLWRMPGSNHSEIVSVQEICQFAYPYPNQLKKVTARSSLQADEFVFVLSKGGEGDSQAMSRTFGFCRRAIGVGVKDRHDLGPRYPECICLLTSQPLFSLFFSILRAVQGLQLLSPGSVPEFVQGVCAPNPFPHRGEMFRVVLPSGSTVAPTVARGILNELRFRMPPASSDSAIFSDVNIASLLHALGARRYLLILTALLLERRIIMVSSNLRKLTVSIHAAVGALQPFSWQHILIPLLPYTLMNYIACKYASPFSSF
jgi:hypothetical protein